MDFFRLNDPMYLEVNEELGDLVLNKQVEFLHRACEMNYGKSCGDLFDMLSVPAGLGNPAGLPKKSEEILPFDADTKKQLVDRRNQSASKCAQTNQDSCDQLMILEFVLSPNKAKPVAERLCALGVPRGCRMLGYMIERGIGSDSSDEKAKFFYQKACDLKDRLSCEYLEKIWPDFYNSTELAMRKCESQNDKSACQKFVEYTLAKESLNLLAEERTYYHDCLPSPQVPEKAFRAACRLRIMDACAALDDGYNRCNTQCGFIAADSCEDAE
jgi:TPR repeat protein